MYYRGAQAAIVVYDLTSKDSFERAKTWVKELQRQGSPNIVIALSGNKLDLANKRQVDVAEAQAYADENGLLFYETSAKTSANVNELFVAIGKLHKRISYSSCGYWHALLVQPRSCLRLPALLVPMSFNLTFKAKVPRRLKRAVAAKNR